MDTPPSCFQDSSSSSSSFLSSEVDSDYDPEPDPEPRFEPEPRFKRQRLSYLPTQVCIVCYFSTMKSMGYDIVVSDLDSLRSAAAADSIPIRTSLRLKLDRDCKTLFGFCGLGSKLYLFESTPLKSVYKIDLSSYYPYDLTKPTLELERNELHEARHMHHAKSTPYAIPTPDGKKILVLSSLIIFNPSPYKTAGDNDFELYDPHADTWLELPGIRHDWRKYYLQHSCDDFIRIRAFTFIDNSTFFIETTTTSMFSLDLESIHNGWRKMDTFFGADSVPGSNGRFLVIEKKLCVTPWLAYNINKKQRFPHWFSFPLPPFAHDIRPSGPYLVSVLGDDDANNGKYNFCTLLTGISKRTGYPQLILNLNSCDLTKYKEDKEEVDGVAELSKSMTIGDSIKFFLDGEQCRAFFAVSLFSICT